MILVGQKSLKEGQQIKAKQTLDDSEISDIIVVVYNDGVFAISKETAKKFLNKKGDGFSLLIPKEEITLIYKNSIKEKNDKIL